MNIITALGNEENSKKIKEKTNSNVIGTDIQYKEAVLEILEKDNKIDLLILSSILPGELDIYEFINIIKYKSPNLEIIIILEKEDKKLTDFIISKGINNIYYNNKITFDEIILKIQEIENKNKINNKIEELEKIILQNNNKLNKENKIRNKIKKIKEKIKVKNKKIKIKNKKVISIIGAPKVGKTIFTLILSTIINNKKILIIDCSKENNDIQVIIGKKKSKSNNILKWKKNIDVMIASNNLEIKKINEQIEENVLKINNKYDYIFCNIENLEEGKKIINKSDEIILIVEPNLLGIKETKEILSKIMIITDNRKDNIKIIYNKYVITSIKKEILDIMFSDFRILGKIKYDKNYNIFINTNTKCITPKIKKQYENIKDNILLS